MPSKRPNASGYARILQADDDEEEDQRLYSDNEDDPFIDNSRSISLPYTHYAPIQPKPRGHMRIPDYTSSTSKPSRRRRANSGVDIKAINARLERWAEEIKERFTRRRVKGKTAEEERLEIHHSVFTAPDWIRPATKETLDADADHITHAGRLSKLEFDDLVESVRTAIELGVHPTLITQGSSGSYFARNVGGKTVGVFKPKDEEPYASKNPKWTKWLHRNLLPFAFGRAMLIPNLSYVSEAAAYVLDCQLRTDIVPYTDVVGLRSQSFHYDWLDRRAFQRRKRPLPEKLGSFQVFLKGYKGATDFFRDHPWPTESAANGFRDAPPLKRKKTKRWDENCRPGSATVDGDSDSEDDAYDTTSQTRARKGFWTEELQQSFREELEKLVVLDYIMRNTDRGTDNWMIRIDTEKQEATIVKEPPRAPGDTRHDDGYPRRDESMTTSHPPEHAARSIPKLGAIDNSLSWPWKHPDAWRSYPFGWLFLPVSLIGRPFSERTRRHFLPLLTSTQWWSDTQVQLRRCFELDADFQEKMFARQIAVMKGQAWNVVEALKAPDHGPLELTRRNRVLVWDDIVEIPVAVRLPRASEEMRKRAAEAARRGSAVTDPAVSASLPSTDALLGSALAKEDVEEMDIAASRQPSPFLHRATTIDVNNPFNQTHHSSAERSSATDPAGTTRPLPGPRSASHHHLPPHTTRASRRSYDATKSTAHGGRRRFSFAMGARRHGGRAFGDEDDDDEDDGDLAGFAAAATQERSSRRVIVERLEVVKSKTPFFEWC